MKQSMVGDIEYFIEVVPEIHRTNRKQIMPYIIVDSCLDKAVAGW